MWFINFFWDLIVHMNDRLLLVTALESSFIKCKHCSVHTELGDQFQVCHVNFIFSISNEWGFFWLVGWIFFLFSLWMVFLAGLFVPLCPWSLGGAPEYPHWEPETETAALQGGKENSQSCSTCSVFMSFPPHCHALPVGSCCSPSWHCQVTFSQHPCLPSTRLREPLTSPYQCAPCLSSGSCVGTALTRAEEPTGLSGCGPMCQAWLCLVAWCFVLVTLRSARSRVKRCTFSN